MKNLLFAGAAAILITARGAAVQPPDSVSANSRNNSRPVPSVTALNTNHNGIAKHSERLSFTTYLQCRLHIEKNFQRLTSLRQIAMESHLSEGDLISMFERYGHENPYQYLLRINSPHVARQIPIQGVASRKDAAPR